MVCKFSCKAYWLFISVVSVISMSFHVTLILHITMAYAYVILVNIETFLLQSNLTKVSWLKYLQYMFHCSTAMNECDPKDPTHACAQICVNQKGSHTCACEDGYRLAENTKNCSGKDEHARKTNHVYSQRPKYTHTFNDAEQSPESHRPTNRRENCHHN